MNNERVIVELPKDRAILIKFPFDNFSFHINFCSMNNFFSREFINEFKIKSTLFKHPSGLSPYNNNIFITNKYEICVYADVPKCITLQLIHKLFLYTENSDLIVILAEFTTEQLNKIKIFLNDINYLYYLIDRLFEDVQKSKAEKIAIDFVKKKTCNDIAGLVSGFL